MVSYKWFRDSSIIHKQKTKAINVQWVSSSNFFDHDININSKYLSKNEFISYISSCFIRSEWSLRRAIYLNRTGVQLGNPKSACCCYGNSGQLWELFTTKFKSQIKRGFTKVDATRVGRLWESLTRRAALTVFGLFVSNYLNAIVSKLAG